MNATIKSKIADIAHWHSTQHGFPTTMWVRKENLYWLEHGDARYLIDIQRFRNLSL